MEHTPNGPESPNIHVVVPQPFDMEAITQQRPFEEPGVQQFFTEWCAANDSIKPVYVSREAWNELVESGRELTDQPGEDGKRELAVPTDLHLYEMVDVMETVDADTYSNHPAEVAARRGKVTKLGETFADAGAYIAARLDAITDDGVPRELATRMAEQFYDYGRSLVTGHQPPPASAEQIAALPQPSVQRLEELDRWLAGDKLYEARSARALRGDRATHDADPIEQARRETLDQFFRASARSYRRQQSPGELRPATHLKPWQSVRPVHDAFLTDADARIARAAETPKRELASAIFRRGMDMLRREMGTDSIPDHVKATIRHWEMGEAKLHEALGIDQMREELEQTKAGNVSDSPLTRERAIASKQRQIADRIQAAVSRYKYEMDTVRPAEILETEQLNCVGFSTLGGALMNEAGLDYLVVDMPTHSVLMLVTSDGELEWRDMQTSARNMILNDSNCGPGGSGRTEATTQDVVNFSRNPSSAGINLEIPMDVLRSNGEIHRTIPVVRLMQPGVGQELQVLRWVGDALQDARKNEAARACSAQAKILDPDNPLVMFNVAWNLDSANRYEEAVEAYRVAIALDPEMGLAYCNLGSTLVSLGRDLDAVIALEKAVELDPDIPESYVNLGISLVKLDRPEEAVTAIKKAIELDPAQKYINYHLGLAYEKLNLPSKAISAYEAFLLNADQSYRVMVNKAKAQIELLRQQLP